MRVIAEIRAHSASKVIEAHGCSGELPADSQSPVNNRGQVDTGALGRPLLNQTGQGTAVAQLRQDPVRELILRGLYGSLSRPRFIHGGPCLLVRVGVRRGQSGFVEAHPARLAGALSAGTHCGLPGMSTKGGHLRSIKWLPAGGGGPGSEQGERVGGAGGGFGCVEGEG